MFEVRVEADFSAAHFLKDYHGKCENLHGHNYTVYAHAKGQDLNEGGMLLDFSQLKNALRTVCKKLDHTNLNDLTEENDNTKYVFMQNPSAERIAYWIFTQVKKSLCEMGLSKESEYLFAVDVFETPTSKATYIKD